MARAYIPGLVSTDRQSQYISGVVWKSKAPEGVSVVSVANPTGKLIENQIVKLGTGQVMSGGKNTPCVVKPYAEGTEVAQQLETGDSGDGEIVFLVDKLEPRSAKFFRVEASPGRKFIGWETVNLPYEYDNGRMSFRKNADTAVMLDEVSLDGIKLGKMEALIHEKLPQDTWLPANKIVSVKGKQGPVQVTLEYQLELDSGKKIAAITEVDANGKMKEPQNTPQGAFQTSYRICISKGVPFYTVQFRSIKNTSANPWRFEHYFHHMPSFIGGSQQDDLPNNGKLVTEYYEPTILWYDAKVGAGYGAVRPRSLYGSTFYIDPSGREHADLCRMLRMNMFPGQSWETDCEPEVPIFGCKGSEDQKPWIAASHDVRTRAEVTVQVEANGKK